MTQAEALLQAHAMFVQHRLDLLFQADGFFHHSLVGAEDFPPLPASLHPVAKQSAKARSSRFARS
jgi:hypothetical protein